MKLFRDRFWIAIVGLIVVFSLGFYCGKVEQRSVDAGVNNESIVWEEQEIVSQNKFYITGEVANSGLYEFEDDICIMEAIEIAGGLTENGDINVINPARNVKDGEKIVIPSFQKEEKSNEIKTSTFKGSIKSSRININVASLAELMELPNIGKTKAQAIINFREKNGMFSSTEEIMDVPGIGQKTFDSFKDTICIDGSAG
ncbi:MAG: helix-hairpin-helix domain-containing protein [Caldisericia bacterium]|nr:helix-hairpin-helix domain-containing protein [Caldisericia bacterium]